jgi:hypothetical protein
MTGLRSTTTVHLFFFAQLLSLTDEVNYSCFYLYTVHKPLKLLGDYDSIMSAASSIQQAASSMMMSMDDGRWKHFT